MHLLTATPPDALLALTLTIFSAQAAALGMLWRRVHVLTEKVLECERRHKRADAAKTRKRP